MKNETIILLRRENFHDNYVYFLNVALEKALIDKHIENWQKLNKNKNKLFVKSFIRWTDKAGYLDIYYE